MLPRPGIYYFPWEVSDGQVPDGSTLRTFGRLLCYDMTRSLVTLTAQQRSDQCQLRICTKLVEPFEPRVGFLYMVLGELEHEEGSVVKARLLTCVEGMDLSLLEKAILEQRLYLQKKQQPIGVSSTLPTLRLEPESSSGVGWGVGEGVPLLGTLD
ncbi:CST complex subunit TEN1 [Lemmus lemmus]